MRSMPALSQCPVPQPANPRLGLAAVTAASAAQRSVYQRSATCRNAVQLAATQCNLSQRNVPQATLDSVGKLSATLQTRACPARQHQ
jgi:hypothetical protein